MAKSKKIEKTSEELEKEKEEKNKALLIDTINKKGFILEERTWKVFHNLLNLREIKRGFIPKKYPSPEGERIEIDVVGAVGDKHFIVECKHTDYSWIFPKSLDRPNTLNFIHNYTDNRKLKTNSRPTSDFKVVFSDLCVMFDEKNSIKVGAKSKYAQTSYKDVHDHIRQVIKNLKAYLYDYDNHGYNFFIPLIVTNADLFFLDYDEKDVDKKGDITNFKSLEKIPYLVYNFSEMIGANLIENEEQMKSIFIVNIHFLEEAIKLIIDQRLGKGRGK